MTTLRFGVMNRYVSGVINRARDDLFFGGLGLGGFRFGGGVSVFPGEALNAASGVDQLLLTGEEGMAVRADFHAQHIAFDGRARLEGVAAGAVHCNGMIVGMNTWLHGTPFFRVRSARRLSKREGP